MRVSRTQQVEDIAAADDDKVDSYPSKILCTETLRILDHPRLYSALGDRKYALSAGARKPPASFVWKTRQSIPAVGKLVHFPSPKSIACHGSAAITWLREQVTGYSGTRREKTDPAARVLPCDLQRLLSEVVIQRNLARSLPCPGRP